MLKKIPFFDYPQLFNSYEEDLTNIFKDVGKRGAFIMQKDLEEFEANLTNYTGAKHSIAVNSATSGLHLACLSLGLKEGDYLWTTAISFVASANCALYC